MMHSLKPFFRAIGYLASIHAVSLLFSSLCRLVMLIANGPEGGAEWSITLRAMLIGVKFDNLIASYIASLPVLIVPVYSLATMHRADYARRMKPVITAVSWYYSILYSIVLFISIADVRYFHFFENHLNIGVTEWFGFVGETAGLVFGDPVNWIYLAISIVLIAGYIVCVKKCGHIV